MTALYWLTAIINACAVLYHLARKSRRSHINSLESPADRLVAVLSVRLMEARERQAEEKRARRQWKRVGRQ